MEKLLYNYLNLNNITFEDFCKNLIIDNQGVFKYNNNYYYIIPISKITDFYKQMRKGCELEIKSHIPENFHIYINYSKFYADHLYNSQEYEFFSSMNTIDYKYKIGSYSSYPKIPKI